MVEQHAINNQGFPHIDLHPGIGARDFIGDFIHPTDGFGIIIRLYGEIIPLYIPPGPFGCEAATQSIGQREYLLPAGLGSTIQGEKEATDRNEEGPVHETKYRMGWLQ